MSRYNAKLDFPKNYLLIFQSSYNEDEFYGLDEFESRKLKIIQAKYGCHHCFHTLPDNVTLDLHPFVWNRETQSFTPILDNKVTVQLNTLEESIINFHELEGTN